MLAVTQSTAYLAVGVLSLIGVVVAGYFANRTRQQISKVETSQRANESAISGLDHLATQLQKRLSEMEKELTEAKIEAREARSEVRSLRVENVDVKLRLDECKQNEALLSARVAQLEAQ